jgi:hypothetical protein
VPDTNQTLETIEAIRKVVEAQLAPAEIVDVSVREDVDSDGEDVLRVDVVFRIDGNRLDPEKVLGLVRHLREPFEKLHEDRFPIFSFMKPEDMNGAAA